MRSALTSKLVLSIAIAFFMLIGSSSSTAFAETASIAPSRTPENSAIEGNAAIKAIGPLHLSEGKVVMQQNQIAVLSDPTDSIADAELSGAIIQAHTTDDANGRIVGGIAIFTKGFSLPAIDDTQAQDSILGNDGIMRIGRIMDVTPKILHIKTAQGVQALPTKYITEIKSPRAFAFTLPAIVGPPNGTASTSSLAPSDSLPAASSATPSEPIFISFRPTYLPDPNKPAPPPQIKTLNAQLTQHHPRKRLFNVAAATAGVAACFAIPIGIALTCPPPRQ